MSDKFFLKVNYNASASINNNFILKKKIILVINLYYYRLLFLQRYFFFESFKPQIFVKSYLAVQKLKIFQVLKSPFVHKKFQNKYVQTQLLNYNKIFFSNNFYLNRCLNKKILFVLYLLIVTTLEYDSFIFKQQTTFFIYI